MIKNSFLNVLFVIACLSIQGCVTTTNRVEVDRDSAHSKRIELGMKYLEVGKRDNARYQFSKALNLKKNSAEAFQGIAMVHQENGEMEPAADAYEKALKYADDSNRSPIQVAYGRYLMEIGKTESACKFFEEAAGDYDYATREHALFLAGQCAAKLGNKLREKSAYEHALNLKSNFTPVLIELAEIYFKEERYSRAKQLLDRYSSLTSPTARSLWLGIRIERIFGNRDKEASFALALKNLYPYSKEYLEYKKLTGK